MPGASLRADDEGSQTTIVNVIRKTGSAMAMGDGASGRRQFEGFLSERISSVQLASRASRE